jgi:hypothetical protein
MAVFNRDFSTFGRYLFLVSILWSVQISSLAQTAPQAEAQDHPLSVRFTNARIKHVLATLGHHIKLDMIFDESVKNVELNIEKEEVTIRQTIEIILKMKKLKAKMKDDHTLVIFADTPENMEKYAELEPWTEPSPKSNR